MFEKIIGSFRKSRDDFITSDSTKKFPIITSSILSGIAVNAFTKTGRSIISNPLSFIWNNLCERNDLPSLQKKETEKPVILFDLQNFLVCNKFSLRRFDFITYKRAFCEEFLFNAAYYYELIALSERNLEFGDVLLKKIDPLGCISYRLFLNNKKEFRIKNLNRDEKRLIVISTSDNEFNRDFDKNVIQMAPFKGRNDTELLDLMHFLINLQFMNLNDFRPTIESYKGKDFKKTFQNVQKRLFSQRNMFSLTSFDKKLREVNMKKIEEYQKIKSKFEKKKSGNSNDYKWILSRFIKSVIL